MHLFRSALEHGAEQDWKLNQPSLFLLAIIAVVVVETVNDLDAGRLATARNRLSGLLDDLEILDRSEGDRA
jgi:hypothetical protein